LIWVKAPVVAPAHDADIASDEGAMQPTVKRKLGMPKPEVRSLWRDAMAVTVVKLAVIVAAAWLVFGPAERPAIDAGRVAARLIGSVHDHDFGRSSSSPSPNVRKLQP
jgi:hypothetical protein